MRLFQIMVLLNLFWNISLGRESLFIKPNYPILESTFVQPELLESWSEEEWDQEFNHLKDIKMDHLILQWSAHSKFKTTVYPSKILGFEQETSQDTLDKLLSMGDRYQLDIYLGLQLNHDFFGPQGREPSWLLKEAQLSKQLAEEIYHNYGHHPSFKGWYLPFEVDNWNFPSEVEWDTLATYYRQVTTSIRDIGDIPIMVSPFFNSEGGLSPEEWQSMWLTILYAADIDIIALQDGRGVGHASLEALGPWFEATREAIFLSGKAIELWADTETFTREFEPMPLAQMLANMRAVRPYVSKFTSFSFLQYNSPLVTSADYYQAYQEYLESGKLPHINSRPPKDRQNE